MKDAVFVGAGDVNAVLTCEDAIAAVTFYPGGNVNYYQLGPDLAEQLFHTVNAHFAAHRTAVRMTRCRGELAPITVADLAPFGAPIVPTP